MDTNTTFNPCPALTEQILAEMGGTCLSFAQLAAKYRTSILAFTRWLNSPQVAALFAEIQAAITVYTRQGSAMSSAAIPGVVHALSSTIDLQAIRDPQNLRAREHARRLISQVLRLSRLTIPGPIAQGRSRPQFAEAAPPRPPPEADPAWPQSQSDLQALSAHAIANFKQAAAQSPAISSPIKQVPANPTPAPQPQASASPAAPALPANAPSLATSIASPAPATPATLAALAAPIASSTHSASQPPTPPAPPSPPIQPIPDIDSRVAAILTACGAPISLTPRPSLRPSLLSSPAHAPSLHPESPRTPASSHARAHHEPLKSQDQRPPSTAPL